MSKTILVAFVGLLALASPSGAAAATVRPPRLKSCPDGMSAQDCCALRKIDAVRKNGIAQGKCIVPNAKTGEVDPHCIDKYNAAFLTMMKAIEDAGGCATVGDGQQIINTVMNVYRLQIAAAYPPSPAPATCGCGIPNLDRVAITAKSPVGSCGTMHDIASMTTNLTCGTTYFGGGGLNGQLPGRTSGVEYAKVASCTGTQMLLGPTTAAAIGNSKQCTSAGCFYGPPGDSGLGTCLVATFYQDLIGTGDCQTGAVSFQAPVQVDVYNMVCPTCVSSLCDSGENLGGACTPDEPGGHSVDCQPTAATLLGTLFTFNFGFTTGSIVLTPHTSNVFCGFCGDGSLNFQNPARACALDGDCTTSPYTLCEQTSSGAFGDSGADSITATGSPAGALVDGFPHDAILADAACVGPSDSSFINSTGNIPSPVMVSTAVTLQLIGSPSGAFLDPVPRRSRARREGR